ncbi:hypothetical protein SEA_Paschalis_91 [Microbacterium phage Paschalis]|uniref:Uncharacterized protein n=1 Tax=Microbacterium phage Paschalis TaxID=2992928 RepID=A0A4P8VZS2_9CAUD|nr:hypothetical protein HOT30_gp59 [Microbacterium phage Paschalis]QCS26947.1 hypothetical protein SEA_Paschalis_91 [Microbacterium phage Paschalis]
MGRNRPEDAQGSRERLIKTASGRGTPPPRPDVLGNRRWGAAGERPGGWGSRAALPISYPQPKRS